MLASEDDSEEPTIEFSWMVSLFSPPCFCFLFIAVAVYLQASNTNIFDNLPALSASKPSELRDELEQYLSTDPEHVVDVLEWWYEWEHIYPVLS